VEAVMTPQQIRREIALIMADGRERTAGDIHTRLKQDMEAIRANLGTMVRWGLLRSDYKHSGKCRESIYRRAG
jgi:hypothetical protein